MRCCIVVKHLGRAELGKNDSPSQSPPVKRPCPDVQVSLTLLYSAVGSNSLSLLTQGVPIFSLGFLIIILRSGNNSRKASSNRAG